MLLFGAPMGESDMNFVFKIELQLRFPVLIVGVYLIPLSLYFATVVGTLFAMVPSGKEAWCFKILCGPFLV
jgi:hypothetical protein